MSRCGGPQELQQAPTQDHMPDNEAQQQKQPAIALPDHIHQRILALALQADNRMLHTAPLVCRAWCAAITPPQELRMRAVGSDLECYSARTTSAVSTCAWLRRNGRGGAVEALILNQYRGVLLGLNAALLPRLRSLTLSGCSLWSVTQLCQGLPGLTSLRLSGTASTFIGLNAEAVAAHLPQLEVLAVEDAWIGPGVATALARLTNLRSLSLQGSKLNRQDVIVLAGALSQLTQLDIGYDEDQDESLHVHMYYEDEYYEKWVASDSIAALTGLRQLADLSIAGSRPDAAAMRALATALTGLTRLNMCHCGLRPEELTPLVSLTRLRSLDLAFNSLSDDVLLTLTKALTQLTCLRMEKYGGMYFGKPEPVVGADTIQPLTRLTSLAKLDMSGARLEATGAQQLAGALPNLASLTVQRCSLGQQGLAALAAGLTKLTHLDAMCNDVGGEATSAAAVQSLTQLQGLRHLNLSRNRLGLEECMPLTAMPGLTCLVLSHNGLTWSEQQALRQCLTPQASQVWQL